MQSLGVQEVQGTGDVIEMTGKKLIGIVFGSKSDLEHVNNVTSQAKSRGWKYLSVGPDGIYVPGNDRAYAVAAGSVHRDPIGTMNYASRLSKSVEDWGDKLIFLTCIGLRDEASGLISSYTGNRVIAVPPDAKEYGRYPNGVRVTPFSSQMPRDADIAAALERIEQEFESPGWGEDDELSMQAMVKARKALNETRMQIYSGEIGF